jgi:hemolysin activation/secretion protein
MADLLELGFVCFIIYLLYKLVFGLVLPVSKAASQVKNKMNEFNQMHQQQARQQQSAPPPTPKPGPKKSSKEDDYIDFEEVK